MLQEVTKVERSVRAMAIIGAIVFLCSSVSAPATSSSNSAVVKYRDFTPEQIRDLPATARENEVPIMYSMAARTGLSAGSQTLFSYQLNRLMYPGVANYSEAVKAFQADVGDAPTGTLTVWQIWHLGQRSELQGLTAINFPARYSDFKDHDFASVSGTWMIHGDRIADPINHTQITCDRTTQTCRVDRTVIVTPDENDFTQNYLVLGLSPDYYDIIRWTDTNIEAVSALAAICRTPSLSLNFDTNEFFEITRNNKNANSEECNMLEPLKTPRIAQVVDGENIIREEFQKIEQAAFDVLSSQFRKTVGSLQNTQGVQTPTPKE